MGGRTERIVRRHHRNGSQVADATARAGMSRLLSARVALQEDFHIRLPSRRPAQVLRRMNLVVSRRVQRLMASLLAIQAAAPASIERELSGSGISRSRTAALNVMDSLLKALQRAGPSTGFRGLKWGDSAAELAAVPIKCRMSHVLARSLALGQASRFSCRGERRGAGNTKGRAAAGTTALKNGCGGALPPIPHALYVVAA